MSALRLSDNLASHPWHVELEFDAAALARPEIQAGRVNTSGYTASANDDYLRADKTPKICGDGKTILAVK
jgi:hypothetical protein